MDKIRLGQLHTAMVVRRIRADGEIKSNVSAPGLDKVVEMCSSVLLAAKYSYRPWRWHERKAEEDSGRRNWKTSWLEKKGPRPGIPQPPC